MRVELPGIHEAATARLQHAHAAGDVHDAAPRDVDDLTVEQVAEPPVAPGPRDDHGVNEGRHHDGEYRVRSPPPARAGLSARSATSPVTMVAAAVQKAHWKNQLRAVPVGMTPPSESDSLKPLTEKPSVPQKQFPPAPPSLARCRDGSGGRKRRSTRTDIA